MNPLIIGGVLGALLAPLFLSPKAKAESECVDGEGVVEVVKADDDSVIVKTEPDRSEDVVCDDKSDTAESESDARITDI